MDTRKKIIIAVIVLAVLLIGVGIVYYVLGPGKSGGKGNTNITSDKIRITYWGLWEPIDVMQPIIDEYEAANTNVEIVYVQKNFTQYEQNLPAQLADAASPDIVRIHNTWTPMLKQYLVPMPSSVMNTTTYGTTYYSIAKESFSDEDGNIYAVPLMIDGLMLYYNKDLFEDAGLDEPPKDWDEFTDYAQKLTKTGTNGKITQAGAAIGSTNNIRHYDELISLLMIQNGVEFFENDEFTLQDESFQPTLKFYTKFVTEYKVWNDGFDDDLKMFYDGEVAMIFAPSWRVFDIIQSNSSLEFDVAPVPQLVGTNEGNEIHLATYWGEAVSKNSKKQAEAWKFVAYLNQPEVLRKLYAKESEIRAFGEPYAQVSMASDLESSPYVDTVIEIAPRMEQIEKIDKTTQADIYATLIDEILSNDSINSMTISNFEDEVNDMLADWET